MTEQQNKNLASSMSQEDHDLMMGLDLDISVDVIETDTITSFIVCNDINIEKIKSLLMKHQVEFETEDTTDFFTDNDFKIEDIYPEYIYEKLGI